MRFLAVNSFSLAKNMKNSSHIVTDLVTDNNADCNNLTQNSLFPHSGDI